MSHKLKKVVDNDQKLADEWELKLRGRASAYLALEKMVELFKLAYKVDRKAAVLMAFKQREEAKRFLKKQGLKKRKK